MDKQQFLKGVHLLENNFGEQPEGKIETMFSIMEKDFDDKTYEMAINYLIKKWKPPFYNAFPVIADFYDFKELRIRMRAEKIVSYIRSNWWISDINKSIDLKDGALHATIRVFGRKELQYDDFWKYNTKAFIDMYVKKVEYEEWDDRPFRGNVDEPMNYVDDYCLKLESHIDQLLLEA